VSSSCKLIGVKHSELADADCAIAQALAVVGDWWTLLVVRDVAGGIHRFDELQAELRVSRKTLTERLATLVEHGVLEKRQYVERPPRYEYHLTEIGRGLLPVLIALQDWGGRHLMGDGALTATASPGSAEARRVHDLIGHRIPALRIQNDRGRDTDPVASTRWTVLYCFAGAYARSHHGYPPGWGDIPGAAGCTLESVTYRDRLAELTDAGATVHGVSTQRPDQLRAFGRDQKITFPLLSDAELQLAASLRLPTFRASGVDRLKRATLIVDADRTIRSVIYPVADPAGSVDDALVLLRHLG
jgi:DNA-binding HxlR family transcriptional regulator/peroxiredoxin